MIEDLNNLYNKKDETFSLFDLYSNNNQSKNENISYKQPSIPLYKEDDSILSKISNISNKSFEIDNIYKDSKIEKLANNLDIKQNSLEEININKKKEVFNSYLSNKNEKADLTKIHSENKLDADLTKIHSENKLDADLTKIHSESKLEADLTKIHSENKLEADLTKIHNENKLEADLTKIHSESKLEADLTKIHSENKLEADLTKIHSESKLDADFFESLNIEEIKLENQQIDLTKNTLSKDHINFQFNAKGRNLGTIGILENMRNLVAKREDLSFGDLSLAETYMEESLNTRTMNGIYNNTISDIYKDKNRWLATQGAMTYGGMIKEVNSLYESTEINNNLNEQHKNIQKKSVSMSELLDSKYKSDVISNQNLTISSTGNIFDSTYKTDLITQNKNNSSYKNQISIYSKGFEDNSELLKNINEPKVEEKKAFNKPTITTIKDIIKRIKNINKEEHIDNLNVTKEQNKDKFLSKIELKKQKKELNTQIFIDKIKSFKKSELINIKKREPIKKEIKKEETKEIIKIEKNFPTITKKEILIEHTQKKEIIKKEVKTEQKKEIIKPNFLEKIGEIKLLEEINLNKDNKEKTKEEKIKENKSEKIKEEKTLIEKIGELKKYKENFFETEHKKEKKEELIIEIDKKEEIEIKKNKENIYKMFMK